MLPSLRLGAGFGVAITSISQTQILSMRSDPQIVDSAILRTADGKGTTWGGQGTFGVQWDVTDRLVAGACLRTPTFTILRTGSLSFQDMETVNSASGPATYQSYFADPNATFSYHLPLTVNFGLAWREPRFDVEIDVRYHSSISEYLLLASSQMVERIATYPDGTQSRTQAPFAGLTYGATTVWNFAVGGRYTLDESWSLHGGFLHRRRAVRPRHLRDLPEREPLRAHRRRQAEGRAPLRLAGAGRLLGELGRLPARYSGSGGRHHAPLILTVSLLYAIAYRF